MLIWLTLMLMQGGCLGVGGGEVVSTHAVPTPSKPAAASTAEAAAIKVFAAGDIADCQATEGAEQTARLLGSEPDVVLALGDLVYARRGEDGFADCYGPNWGRFKDHTYPVPGNHDYEDGVAAGYFRFFGDRAHPPGGYYSFDRGTWHFVALNSNIGLSEGSAQEAWLRHDLAANRRACTLVFLHHPIVSSGWHGATRGMEAVRRVLAAHRVTLVLSGHDHHYERFAPLDSQGTVDVADGTRFFVVGTGGARLYPTLFRAMRSEAVSSESWGVLELSLRSGGYAWTWHPVEPGGFQDAGEGRCAGANQSLTTRESEP